METVVGKYLLIGGSCLALLGFVLLYAPWLLSWFGKLPGDIRIEGQKTFVYIPITSMVLVSVALSLVGWLLKR